MAEEDLQQEQEHAFSVRDYLRTVFKYRRLIVAITITAVVVTMVGSLLTTPVYQAVAKVKLEVQWPDPFLIRSLEDKKKVLTEKDREIFFNTQVEIVKGRQLIKRAVEDLKLHEHKTKGARARVQRGIDSLWGLPRRLYLKWKGLAAEPGGSELEGVVDGLRHLIDVGVVRDTYVLEIRTRTDDPSVSADLANALAREYREEVQTRQADSVRKIKDYIQVRALEVERKCEDSAVRLKDIQEQGIISPDETRELLLGKHSEVAAELDLTVAGRKEAEAQADVIRKHFEEVPEGDRIPSARKVANNPFILAIREQLMDLEAELPGVEFEKGENCAEARVLREQIEVLRRRLGETRERIDYGTVYSHNPHYEDLNKKLIAVDSQAVALRAREEGLARALANYEREIARFPDVEQQYNKTLREKRRVEDIRGLYHGRVDDAALSAKAQERGVVKRVTIQDPAVAPLNPSSPRIFLNVLLALIMSPIVGLGIGFARVRMRRTLETPYDVERWLDLRVLASFNEETALAGKL